MGAALIGHALALATSDGRLDPVWSAMAEHDDDGIAGRLGWKHLRVSADASDNRWGLGARSLDRAVMVASGAAVCWRWRCYKTKGGAGGRR